MQDQSSAVFVLFFFFASFSNNSFSQLYFFGFVLFVVLVLLLLVCFTSLFSLLCIFENKATIPLEWVQAARPVIDTNRPHPPSTPPLNSIPKSISDLDNWSTDFILGGPSPEGVNCRGDEKQLRRSDRVRILVAKLVENGFHFFYAVT